MISNKLKIFLKKILHPYIFSVVNGDTLKERISIKIKPLYVLLLCFISVILIVSITSIFIAFTNLKEYIPGYDSGGIRRKAFSTIEKIDFLDKEVSLNTNYINSIKKILKDSIEIDSEIDEQELKKQMSNNIDLSIKEGELEFRKEVEISDQYNLFKDEGKYSDIVFFSPIKGNVIKKYDIKNSPYVSISCEANSPVKSVADGVVLLTDWTLENGFIIVIKHKQNFISIYRNNVVLKKERGDFVETGEIIASSGIVNALSDEVYLNFELWLNNYPVNPENYIIFKDI
ncbi:murein hydrolase activator EnvC family protein [Ichthyobacterium seriolicida]|uniref:Peptidase M23 n=1 Tax=Ichthyobacterium seriolicida TaxID=242600 RepID=A0A1J1DZT5_9FLAO|nr:M23 family metallopeptidase [Ichthyobacterium seriolicida]BAV95439.1 peptidase M23 [Ichthyobacterium seriolicida]